MTEPTEDQHRVRPFADILVELDGGRTHNELSQAFHELTEAVHEHGKKGAIQFTLSMDPISKSDSETVKLSASVVAKKPKGDPRSSIFFIGDDGNLTRDQPGQMHLPLREVPQPEQGPIRKVN